MGSFEGHLLPGACFLGLGLMWTYNMVRRGIMCRNRNIPYFNTATYPLPMHQRCVRWPMEAGLKILLTSIGMTVELYASTQFGTAGRVVLFGDIQHCTMYAFFFLSGIVDILHCYKKILPGLDHMALGLAFMVEGVLFMHHLHGLEAINVQVHTLLIYVVFACVVACFMELTYNHSLLMALTRAFLVNLQGTWFIHVGIIIYHPGGFSHWEINDENVMIVTMMFTWHALGVILLMAMVSFLSYKLNTKSCSPTSEDYNVYEMLSSATGEDGEDDEGTEMVGDVSRSDKLCEEGMTVTSNA